MPRALIYGFGPYQSFRDNVTERTLRSMKAPPGVALHVFDVKFDAAMFERVFDRVRPGVVVGLGQHPRARKLRLERRAHARGDPHRARFVTLDLPRTRDTTVTYDAGDYVCNYSMWVATGWCARHGARYAFVHVPRDFPPARLESYLRAAIRPGRRGGGARSSPRGPARSR